MATMVAVTIAAHIGRRSELATGDGMMFLRCLIRADYMRAPMTRHLVAVRRGAAASLISGDFWRPRA